MFWDLLGFISDFLLITNSKKNVNDDKYHLPLRFTFISFILFCFVFYSFNPAYSVKNLELFFWIWSLISISFSVIVFYLLRKAQIIKSLELGVFILYLISLIFFISLIFLIINHHFNFIT